jgi:hypothetical protein
MKYDEKAIDLRMRFDFPGSHYFPAGRNWQMENRFRYADLRLLILPQRAEEWERRSAWRSRSGNASKS